MTDLGLVGKLDKCIAILAQRFGLYLSTNMSRLDATNALVVLGSDTVQSLHTRQLGRRHVLLTCSSQGARADTVVARTGERTDDAEPDDDGQVESVRSVPVRGCRGLAMIWNRLTKGTLTPSSHGCPLVKHPHAGETSPLHSCDKRSTTYLVVGRPGTHQGQYRATRTSSAIR